MGHVPSRIVRWGSTVLFAVVLLLVVGSFFFRYPDVIEAEMRLTSRNPVTEVVARTSGRVSGLYVADGQEVKEGLPLAVIENTAVTEDVLRLKKLLARYAGEPERLGYYLLQDVWQLGDIQPAYTALASKDPASRDYRAALGAVVGCGEALGDGLLHGGIGIGEGAVAAARLSEPVCPGRRPVCADRAGGARRMDRSGVDAGCEFGEGAEGSACDRAFQ